MHDVMRAVKRAVLVTRDLMTRITSCIKYLFHRIINDNLRHNSACLALKFNERKLSSLARFNNSVTAYFFGPLCIIATAAFRFGRLCL